MIKPSSSIYTKICKNLYIIIIIIQRDVFSILGDNYYFKRLMVNKVERLDHKIKSKKKLNTKIG